MELEGKGLINGNLMRQVEVVPDEDMPIMLIACLANQELIVYYDEAISPELQSDLAAGIFHIKFPEIVSLLNILNSYKIQSEIGHYKTYLFSSDIVNSIDHDVICLSKHDPKVHAFRFDHFAEQVCAIERDNRIVSACVSTRENEKCGEAWVYTNPQYRHQGFAKKVVSTWARSLMDAGKVPFYSHKITNVASSSLARALGLQPVFEEISITSIST